MKKIMMLLVIALFITATTNAQTTKEKEQLIPVKIVDANGDTATILVPASFLPQPKEDKVKEKRENTTQNRSDEIYDRRQERKEERREYRLDRLETNTNNGDGGLFGRSYRSGGGYYVLGH